VTVERARRHLTTLAACALVLADVGARVVHGGPYPGATALLLAACATTLLPFVPRQLARPALGLAVFPALGVGAFTILLTSLSTLGIPLTEVSIRVAVVLLIAAGFAVRAVTIDGEQAPRVALGRELAAAAIVLAVALFSFASSWDIVGPYPPRGTDWGHYFLYADEVDRQGGLLIDDPYAGRDGELFADPVMVGALYGGTRILDGVSSRTLGVGVPLASAASTMSVVTAAGGLWGIGGGLAAGALYAVAPIRIDPMYWHGLGTTLALLFLPLLVLALGLMFRGARDARTVGLLAFALVSIGAAHTTTAVVGALAVAAAVVLDALRAGLTGRGEARFLTRWWRRGAIAPLLAGVAAAAVVGAGVGIHVLRQAAELGDPVDYRFFDPDWLSLNSLDEYLSAEFLLVAGVSLLVLLLLPWHRSARSRDGALLAVGAVLLGSIAASQLWRLEIPYEYRRAVYPFGLALALLFGAAAARIARRTIVVPVCLVLCAYFAHTSVGLRLPQRLLAEHVPASSAPGVLASVRERIDRGELPDTRLVVTDQCLHFLVPYLFERPTIAAFEEWQVALENRLPAARRAAAILDGGPRGRRLATELNAGYVVVDPRCRPDAARGLGGTVVVRDDDVLVMRLPDR
jgi:hypothetical protein